MKTLFKYVDAKAQETATQKEITIKFFKIKQLNNLFTEKFFLIVN